MAKKTDLVIVDARESYRKAFGRMFFVNTKFICRRKGVEDDYYYGVGKYHIADVTPEILKTIRLIKIPNDRIFPRYEEGLTIAPDPLPHNVYIKSPRLIDFNDTHISHNLGFHLLHEARVCELLKKNPHPNIAQYHGCIVKNGRIRGLVFKRYPLSLRRRATEHIPINIHHTVKYVKQAIKHMHTLDIAHNNIGPDNIMMDGDMPIVIDFAATLDYGVSLAGYRHGVPPWLPPEAKQSKDYNDYYAALQVYHWLRT